MEGMVQHDQLIGKGSAVANKCFPPSYENDVSPGASVLPMQTNQTPAQSFGGSADVSQSNGSRMVSTRYNTRQHVPSKPAASRPRGPAWLLIEWERPTGEVNSCYDVIASTQIVDRAPDRLDPTVGEGRKKPDAEYYTGNLVHVQRGQHALRATIVMVSDDKKFIETELRQLRKMATHKLNTKPSAQISSVQRQPNSTTLEQQMYSQAHREDSDRGLQFPEWKHRTAVQHQDTQVPAKKRTRTDSAGSSCRESSFSPCPTASEASHRTGTLLSGERTITPRSDRAARSNAVQPMTFDQQTQTIGLTGASGHDVQFAKVLSYLESIMAEQKRCQMEREYDRKLLHDLHEKQVVHEGMLRRVEENITLGQTPNHTDPDNGGTVPGNVPDNDEAIELSLIDRCLMTDEDGQLLGEYRYDEDGFIDDSARETVTDVHLDANRNQSWVPSVDATTKTVRVASNNTASIDTGGETASASYSIVAATENYVFPPSDQITTPRAEVKQFDLIDDLKKDWNDHVANEEEEAEEEEEHDQSNGDGEKSTSREATAETAKCGSGEEMVSIGAHGTLVKQSALDKIKWSNYKSATRKLLMEAFGREMLATHSLSGRPSPALRGNADKPVKDRLDPNVVADVTEMVCKMCNANESLIRNVITAKCADENKMSKQRAGLMPQRLAPPKTMEPRSVVPAIVDNKENISNGRG